MKKYLNLILTSLFITNLYGAETYDPETPARNYTQKFTDLYKEQKYSECYNMFNALSNTYQTYLFWFSCKYNNINMVKYLYQNFKYIDVNYKIDKMSSLEVACKNGHIKIAKFLLKKKELSLLANNDLLEYASNCGNFAVVKYLINNHNLNINENILKNAIRYSMPTYFIKYLINHKNTPYDLNFSEVLYEAYMSGNYEITKFLIIEKKTDFDLTTTLKDIAFMLREYSEKWGSDDYWFKRNRTDLNKPVRKSPLKERKLIINNYIKIIIFLLKTKVNITTSPMNINFEVISNYMLLKIINKLAEAHVLHMIKKESLKWKFKSPEIISLLLTNNFNINETDFDNYLKNIHESISEQYYMTQLYNYLFSDKRPTIQRFFEVKNLIVNIIESGDTEKIKLLKAEHINLMFSNAQLAKLLTEKICDKNYDNRALEILIHKFTHRLEDLFYQDKHILNYALKYKRRNISTLIITLCPNILDNLNDFLDYDNLLEFIDIGKYIKR